MNFKQFGSLLPDNPLCGIGIYKDTLDLSNGGCTRYVKKYVFTGSENWRKSSSISGVYWTDGIIDDGNNTATGSILGISTHYKGVASNTGVTGLNNNEIRVYASTSSTICHEVYLRDERFDTKEAFIDWLTQQYTNGNPVTLWYVLATPTTETITVPTGLSGTEEGYLNQSGTPTPTNPIYPTANEVKVWHDIPYYQHKTATDTLSLPAVIYPNDTSITVGLKGNEEHTGTPSPQNPVMPNGTGDMSGNLFDISLPKTDYATNVYQWTLSGLTPNAQYTCSSNFVQSGITASIWFGGTSSGTNRVSINAPKTMTANSNGEIIMYINHSPNNAYDQIVNNTTWVMVNAGSTALPYEPYGYKIPISSGGTTTNVYLGEVQSTRQIVKTVLTSSTNVDWAKSSSRNYAWYFSPPAIGAKANTPFLCSHGATVTSVNEYVYGTVYCDNTVNLGIFPSTLTNVSSLKNWLDEQNANGTPVVIWNVLTTPTTGIVNEPIRKIGDYADTVSGISVPTTTGKDSFDVLTTLKPSEVSLAYTGWHDASAKEWDGSEWQ